MTNPTRQEIIDAQLAREEPEWNAYLNFIERKMNE